MVNSFIHVLMYSYYGLAALGPAITKYLWWKKYLTILQLIQFTTALILGINGIRSGCDFPLWMQYALVIYMISFIVLFGNFYAKAYIAKVYNIVYFRVRNCSCNYGLNYISFYDFGKKKFQWLKLEYHFITSIFIVQAQQCMYSKYLYNFILMKKIWFFIHQFFSRGNNGMYLQCVFFYFTIRTRDISI